MGNRERVAPTDDDYGHRLNWSKLGGRCQSRRCSHGPTALGKGHEVGLRQIEAPGWALERPGSGRRQRRISDGDN